MQVLGYLLAFAAAAGVTLYDCQTTAAQSIKRVPGLIAIHPGILVLVVGCGLLAVVAFGFTDPKGTDVVSTALTLKVQSPILRGLVVGAMILALLRSKLFNIHTTGVGGDAIYTQLRALTVQSLNDWRTYYRTKFLDRNINAAFALPNYFDQVESLVSSSISARSAPFQKLVRNQLRTIKSKAPNTPMSQNDPPWDTYYRSFTSVCYDYCGPTVLISLQGFQPLPRPGRWG